MFQAIRASSNWVKIEKVDKGWSLDKKYHIYDQDGNEYLLRVSKIESKAKKQQQFELLKQVKQLNIHASSPVEFGILNEQEVYMLLTWLKGEDASEVVPTLPFIEQYNLGIEAGKILYKLHQLPLTTTAPSWWERYQIKIQNKIKMMQECPIEISKKDIITSYVKKHMHLVKDQPTCFQHGDYHLGNMIVDQGKIGIIDFDKFATSDPIDDFKPFCWNVMKSPLFETGLIDGYFNHNIPDYFFPLLALYAAESLLGHLPWAIAYGEEEVKTALEVHHLVLGWYDDFNRVIPTWYTKEAIQKENSII